VPIVLDEPDSAHGVFTFPGDEFAVWVARDAMFPTLTLIGRTATVGVVLRKFLSFERRAVERAARKTHPYHKIVDAHSLGSL
jgi:hypothetical protein